MERVVAEICARLYHGWAEKVDLPELGRDPVLMRAVQDQLIRLGLELVDRPDCRWYVVRLRSEYDSFAQFSRRNQSLKGNHLALVLILYTKLLLPRRVGQVSPDEELTVTFQEIFQSYGHKFVPRRRRTAAESGMKSALSVLVRLGFIVKRRGEEVYEAGPAMYMLHDDLLPADLVEASLRTLFALDTPTESSTETDIGTDGGGA